ncbi:alpha/beta-hydrolase [Coniochaeta ligniaria NRRL 30616]|uniref:Alpha/beta-hydrolase n=1 Tax=Coniochaeta ligniaria NRRL 30616 TaxID=1408157 RepID=A0A1J7IWM0_9PEZI|nr:alpha/beta-hydrolase [Coniochaeta ligniaria NRRL 30616]
MADPEIATKAPESDAQEVVPTDLSSQSATQSSPKLGEHCTTDRPAPSGEASTGVIEKLGGFDAYISKPPDYPHTPARLLLLLTSGTGIKSVNNQIQADRFASEGFVVVMPDLFDGDAAPNSTRASVPDEASISSSPSFLDKFKTKIGETAKSFMIDMWLARHTDDKVLPLLHKVLDGVRDEFADAVSHGGGVYAVGYCFGARYVLLLASERPPHQQGIPTPWSATQKPSDEEGQASKTVGPHIKVGALAHATMVSKDDFQGLKAPVSLVCVENDPLFPDEVRTAGEDYMSKNNVEHEVSVYPGVPHGFAVVGEYDDDHIKLAQITAYEQMLKWLKEH